MKLFCVVVSVIAAHVSSVQIELQPPRNYGDSPIGQVVTLIADLKSQLTTDMNKATEDCDKGGCQCETDQRTHRDDIFASTNTITDNQGKTKKHAADIATRKANVKQLTADIEGNKQAIKDADTHHEKETADWMAEDENNNNAVKALESAINILAPRQEGEAQHTPDFGGAFLQKKAQINGIAEKAIDGLRDYLSNSRSAAKASPAAMRTLEYFVANPEKYIGKKQSLVQSSNNPHGDYAPQSGQIFGILQDQMDQTKADIASDKEEQDARVVAHHNLRREKVMEGFTLEASLVNTNNNLGESKVSLATARQDLLDAQKDKKASEAALEASVANCRNQANACSEEARLRTEEMHGMQEAIDILEAGADTFKESSKNRNRDDEPAFIQEQSEGTSVVAQRLLELAQKTGSAKIMSLAKATGSRRGALDKVVAKVDEMVTIIRKDIKGDETHRDKCREEENGNAAEESNLENKKAHQQQSHDATTAKKTESQRDLLGVTNPDADADGIIIGRIPREEALIQEQKEHLDTETADNKKFIDDDQQAIKLIEQAKVKLLAFQKNNAFLQKPYEGRRHESGGIIAILEMIQEDIQNELQKEKDNFEKIKVSTNKAINDARDRLSGFTEKKNRLDGQILKYDQKLARIESAMDTTEDEQTANGHSHAATGIDCSWVEEHFESRRSAMQTEIDGLIKAKGIINGIA